MVGPLGIPAKWRGGAAWDMSIDERSRLAIYRLVNRGVIATVGRPIKQGKESIVIDATAPDGTRLAVKVHTSQVFGGREKKQYLFGD